MTQINQQTKAKILAAAEVVFHENGFKGARTTLIAKKAGVSRTMLHYYYRTKEDLFHEVLQNSFGFFVEHAQRIFIGENSLQSLINSLIDLLFDVLIEKPSLPSFIVNILNESPELITNLPIIKEEKLPTLFDAFLKSARKKKEIHSSISGEDLLLNIYGLCVIPYLVAPLISFKENRTEPEMDLFLKNRRNTIKTFVWSGLQAA
jgi:TetR/AcrR family transcriptional regulator